MVTVVDDGGGGVGVGDDDEAVGVAVVELFTILGDLSITPPLCIY